MRLLPPVEDGLEPELCGRPGGDICSVHHLSELVSLLGSDDTYCVLEAEAVVVVCQEVSDGGVVPSNNDRVRLDLRCDIFASSGNSFSSICVE